MRKTRNGGQVKDRPTYNKLRRARAVDLPSNVQRAAAVGRNEELSPAMGIQSPDDARVGWMHERLLHRGKTTLGGGHRLRVNKRRSFWAGHLGLP